MSWEAWWEHCPLRRDWWSPSLRPTKEYAKDHAALDYRRGNPRDSPKKRAFGARGSRSGAGKLIDERLLISREDAQGESQIEISHESLIGYWRDYKPGSPPIKRRSAPYQPPICIQKLA